MIISFLLYLINISHILTTFFVIGTIIMTHIPIRLTSYKVRIKSTRICGYKHTINRYFFEKLIASCFIGVMPPKFHTTGKIFLISCHCFFVNRNFFFFIGRSIHIPIITQKPTIAITNHKFFYSRTHIILTLINHIHRSQKPCNISHRPTCTIFHFFIFIVRHFCIFSIVGFIWQFIVKHFHLLHRTQKLMHHIFKFILSNYTQFLRCKNTIHTICPIPNRSRFKVISSIR
ncbi:hypothetical protein MNB_SV-13-622 [hydrothermal vent metagenome]|uniref:Uncharacterized protein n=1 Tax=hydrothermal vent metagenome TaxID=652676 RepID=A0A1W1D1C4_9ZZZZ